MNSTVFANLPRFDQAETVIGLSDDDLKRGLKQTDWAPLKDPPPPPVELKVPAKPVELVEDQKPAAASDGIEFLDEVFDDAFQDAEPEVQPVESPTREPVLDPIAAELDVALEHALMIFESGLQDIRHQIKEEAGKVALTLVSEMLPKVSEAFLADELARHLPDLLPTSAPDITIQTSPAIAETLRDILNHRELAEPAYKIEPKTGFDFGRLEVSWKTGGLSADFSRRLETCLEDLKAQTLKSGT